MGFFNVLTNSLYFLATLNAAEALFVDLLLLVTVTETSYNVPAVKPPIEISLPGV